MAVRSLASAAASWRLAASSFRATCVATKRGRFSPGTFLGQICIAFVKN